MKYLESDHNTVQVTNYDWQKKDKCISGMGSWFWCFGKVYIRISLIASLKSGQFGASFPESRIKIKGYILNDPF